MRKKIGLMVIMAMLATAFLVTDSSAAPAFYVCTVEAAGPQDDGVIFIALTSGPTFTWKWFLAPTNIEKQILVTALTALSSGSLVLVQADLNAGYYPLIKNFYMLK